MGRGARVFRPISFHSNEPWHTARGRCGFQYPQVGILILPGVSKDAHQDVVADANDRGLQRLGDVPPTESLRFLKLHDHLSIAGVVVERFAATTHLSHGRSAKFNEYTGRAHAISCN